MRLSSRLSDKSKNHGEIESFIDWEKYTISPEESEDLQLISAGEFRLVKSPCRFTQPNAMIVFLLYLPKICIA